MPPGLFLVKLVDSFDISHPGAEKQTNSCGGYFTADNRFVCSYANKGKTCNEYVMSTQTVESEETTRTVTGTWSYSSGCCNKRNGSCPPTSTCSSSIKYTSSNGQIVVLPDANDACRIQCPSGRCGHNDGLSTSCRISTSSTVDRCTPYTWDGTELGRVFKYSVATLNCRVQTSTQPVKKTKYHLDVYEVTCCE